MYLEAMTNNNLKESFGTLSETINGLAAAGYSYDFNIEGDCLICHTANITLSPQDFEIDKVYRFEGESNPDDSSIVYAISSTKFDLKGTLVNGYGISADEVSSTLVEKLRTNKSAENNEQRSNDATPQRPEGNRVLDASLVEMDLNKFIAQIKNESTWNDSDRNSVTIFKSETLRIVLMGLHKNAELKSHKAKGIISVQVLEGKMHFVVDGKKSLLEKGQMIALHENIMHSVEALDDTFFLLTFGMARS